LEIFLKSPANADLQGEQKTSYNLALNFSKKGKPYCICEEVIVPALEEVIKNMMNTNPDPVLKSAPLSASTVKRRIDEMAYNVENLCYRSCSAPRFYYNWMRQLLAVLVYWWLM